MFSKKSLPIVFLLIFAGSLIAFNSSGFGNPPDKFHVIFTQVAEMLEVAHYNPKKIDDNFSVRTQFKYSHINKEIGDSDVKIKSLTQLSVGFAYNF